VKSDGHLKIKEFSLKALLLNASPMKTYAVLQWTFSEWYQTWERLLAVIDLQLCYDAIESKLA
jgi:hypothetical protein